jgi:AcrR family transcriptional regulator
MAPDDLEDEETRAFEEAMAGAATIEQRATPAAAFARAREMFLSGERLDMGQLAAELGVARATLYRWTGDRNRLLGDIVWTELRSLFEHIDDTTPGEGVDRLERMAGVFLDGMSNNTSLSAFLALEGPAGVRLFTNPTGHVRKRIIAAVIEMIGREADAGHYRPPDDPRILAEAVVSIGERFLYHSGDQAMSPDPATAKRIIGLLLRESASAPDRGTRQGAPGIPSARRATQR